MHVLGAVLLLGLVALLSVWLDWLIWLAVAAALIWLAVSGHPNAIVGLIFMGVIWVMFAMS